MRSPGKMRGQRGHLMAGLMVLVAVMMILSTLVFQGWQDVKRRDDEAEMIFRAQEIVRAIVRFRKDRGTGPNTLEQLMEPGPRGQYYLRRLYEDPLVEGGEWGLLYVGPNNEILDPSAGAALGGQPSFGGMRPSEMDATTRERLNAHLQRRRDKARDRGIELEPRPLSGGLVGQAGQQAQVGGLPIGGVKTLATEQPFRVYKGLTEYSEWLFTYLDLEIAQIPGQKAGGRTGTGGALGGGRQGGGRSVPGGNSGGNSDRRKNRGR